MKSGAKTSPEKWIKENVEAVAIAVVMALVIRQFAIEAFKIPTESMAPTLLGESLGGGTGDRILVDKMPVLFGEPDRWDVIVFKYPLNASKNYIKRLVGLPGETLSIIDGDVYIDGKIQRKPDAVQEVLFFPVYPETLPPEERSRAFSGDGDHVDRVDGGFAVDSPGGRSLVRYDKRVRDVRVWDSHTSSDEVNDVRLIAEVTPEGGAVVFRLQESGVPNELVLAVGEGRSVLRHGEVEREIDATLEAGETVEVSFANVDDALVAVVDGDDFRWEYESEPYETSGPNLVSFGVESGRATFTEIRIERDVYYVPTGVHRDVKLPDDGYFVLGDNSRDSADSRRWTVRVVRLKDGTEYLRDGDGRSEDLSGAPPVGPGEERFQDVDGIWRVVKAADVASSFETKTYPFVRREHLIGRAFLVFWPFERNPATGRFRLKFIR